MGTKTLAGQRHTVAWPARSRGWCARGPRIKTRGSHHIIAHVISRQIGFSGSGVRIMMRLENLEKDLLTSAKLVFSHTFRWNPGIIAHRIRLAKFTLQHAQ